MRLRTSLAAILTIAVALAAGWAVSARSADGRAALAQALAAVPANTRVAGFTDWARIRTTLGFDASRDNRDAFLARADGQDYTARSVLSTFSDQMVETYGWSVDDVRWEIYGQASAGSIVVAAMTGSLKASTVVDGLKTLGYTRSGDVWSIDPAELAGTVPGLAGAFGNIAVDAGKRLIFLSGSAAYLRSVLAVSDTTSLAGVGAARQAAEPLIGAQSAVISLGRDACEAVGFAGLSEPVRRQARNTVAPLGRLAAYRYGGRAVFAGGGVPALRFSMTFDSAVQAAGQAAIRRQLTTGRFVGRTGQIGDVLTYRSTRTKGSALMLAFDFDAAKIAVMSGNGPLLFAACTV